MPHQDHLLFMAGMRRMVVTEDVHVRGPLLYSPGDSHVRAVPPDGKLVSRQSPLSRRRQASADLSRWQLMTHAMLRYGMAVGLVMIGLACGWPVPVAAQSGQLTSMVVDATGGVLPGASVTLIGGPEGPRLAQTDAQGRFTFTGLSPGVYTVTVFLSGFGEVTVEDVAVAADPVELPVITLRLAAFDAAVVVTATRIEEPLQQVPMSLAAVTGADIERRAIDDLTELSRWTLGLTVVDQGARGSNVVIVRGLHTDALTGSEQAGNNYNNGVATYLGDIPLAVDLWLHDIERVEVLLGPQGTLYGAGTLAGAVRYLPRSPDTERRTFEIRGDLFTLAHGGAPGSDAGLTVNLPLVPQKLALRGSVDRYADPGFIDYNYLLRTTGVSEPEPDLTDPEAVAANLRSEPDANTEETVSARLSLLWNATPNLSALAAYHRQDQRVGARQINHAQSFDTGRYVSAHRFLEPNDRKNELLSLELTWALGAVELTSATGYSRFSAHGQRDQTDLLIQEFGIAGLLPGAFPALARAQAIDPRVSATDLTSQFRSFAAYTRENSREERFNWETRLVSTGDGPWALGRRRLLQHLRQPWDERRVRARAVGLLRRHAHPGRAPGIRAGRVLQPRGAGGRGTRAVRRDLARPGRSVAGDGRRSLVRLRRRYRQSDRVPLHAAVQLALQ